MEERKIYVIGGAHTPFIGKFHPSFIWKGHPDFGKRENPTIFDYVRNVTKNAIENNGVPPGMIERGYVGNFVGELFASQGHLGSFLAGVYPEFEGKPFIRVEGACASGGIAFAAGVDAIRAGCDLVIVVGVEVQTTVPAKEGAKFLARAGNFKTLSAMDEFPFPCLFAKRKKAYLEGRKEAKEEDFAHIVVKAYDNANRNPYAHMKEVKITLDQALYPSEKNPLFLTNPNYREYLKVLDCSQVSDGASCVILASQDGLKKCGKSKNDTIEVLSTSIATAPLDVEKNPLLLWTVKKAAADAYRRAGITPSQLDVVEVHDCFSIAEILMYEAIGLADEGRGYELIREGKTLLDGEIPVNTGGGLIAFGHPVGATGVKQIYEIYRQMKGMCGDYQLKGNIRNGLCANMGGDDRTAVVSILRNID